VSDLRAHLELFARGASTPTVGVDIAASYLTEPPTGQIVLTVPGRSEPAVYCMDAQGARELARRFGVAAGMLEEITG
jgi:hypothetical protein